MRKYLKIFTCGVQDATAYRGNLIVGVLSNFVITAVMFYIWQVIYEMNAVIDNYNWEDMKIYLFISFGFGRFCFLHWVFLYLLFVFRRCPGQQKRKYLEKL